MYIDQTIIFFYYLSICHEGCMQIVVLTVQILFVLLVPLLFFQFFLKNSFGDVPANHHNKDGHDDFYYEGYPRQPLRVFWVLDLVEVVDAIKQRASDKAHAAGHEHVWKVADGVVPEGNTCNSHDIWGNPKWSKCKPNQTDNPESFVFEYFINQIEVSEEPCRIPNLVLDEVFE